MLQPTQADANREARERGLKVRAPDMEHEVPTVKADLMAYINDLLEQKPDAHPMVTIEPKLDDGQPDHKPAFTQEQVDAMFTPSTKVVELPRDKVCELISTYEGTDLGFVALEVAARFKALAKRERVND
jgi:hypothetical protein